MSSQRSNKIQAYLIIQSVAYDPETITRIIGIKPNSVAHMGEPCGPANGAPPRKFHWWELRTEQVNEDPELVTISDLFSKILDNIESSSQSIAALCLAKALSIALYAEVYCEAECMPVIDIGPHVVQRAARIGCSIKVDIIC